MLKEQLKNDISTVFINMKEFAQKASINGAEVEIVKDDDMLEYRIKNDYEGIVIGDALFYISESEFNKIPNIIDASPNQKISFEGKPSTIININNELGVYEIIIMSVGR